MGSGNFQFSLYLKESGLSEQERSNMERIFSALRPERQVEIIDHWPKYLDKILEIKHYAEAERKRNILSAFERIEKLLDDAELRAQAAEAEEREREREFQIERSGAEEYEKRRQLDALRKIGRPTIEESAKNDPPPDPLSAFV